MLYLWALGKFAFSLQHIDKRNNLIIIFRLVVCDECNGGWTEGRTGVFRRTNGIGSGRRPPENQDYLLRAYQFIKTGRCHLILCWALLPSWACAKKDKIKKNKNRKRISKKESKNETNQKYIHRKKIP